MYRKIIVPESTNISILLPADFVGQKVEVIAFTVDDKLTVEKPTDEMKYSWENARKFFDAHRVDLSNFNFDRDEANQR
ncbi:MAG: hypothetical protein WCH34_15270 [Bacteroidota bacterium]